MVLDVRAGPGVVGTIRFAITRWDYAVRLLVVVLVLSGTGLGAWWLITARII